jgi:hypothetical protein
MATEQAVHADAIRTVTADEVAFYRENGWVKLERLIEPGGRRRHARRRPEQDG